MQRLWAAGVRRDVNVATSSIFTQVQGATTRRFYTPQFNIVRSHQEQGKGWKNQLTGLYQNDTVVLAYSEPTKQSPVVLTLPASYVARMVSVMEGSGDKVQVQNKKAKGTLAKLVPAAAVPQGEASGAIFELNVWENGQDSNVTTGGNAVAAPAWSWDIQPGEAVVLHRFLTTALHYLHGFGTVHYKERIRATRGNNNSNNNNANRGNNTNSSSTNNNSDRF